MKNIKLIPIIAFFMLIASCNSYPEQTVETGFVDPYFLEDNLQYKIPVNEIMLRYKFSRNGMSNVDYSECDWVKKPIDIIQRRLKKPQIYYEVNYNDILKYYKEGVGQLKPEEQIVSSKIHEEVRAKVKEDIIASIDKSAEISGYLLSNPSSHRNREAVPSQTGYIGYSVGDPNVAFVNEKGVVVSEVFNGMITGAIYLDKILNKHLDEHFFEDEKLRIDHENVVLPAGRNYTVLEHHWDLAYGYFQFLKEFSQPDGIPALKYSEQKLYSAFVQGRLELNRYRYDAMMKQLKIIRKELSKVMAVRVINYLIGANTLVNLKEDQGTDAFAFLSKAYGLIYAMQFTRTENGTPYFTYAEVQKMMSQFTQGDGLWSVERLLADKNQKGSLNNLALQISLPFDFSVEEVRR